LTHRCPNAAWSLCAGHQKNLRSVGLAVLGSPLRMRLILKQVPPCTESMSDALARKAHDQSNYPKINFDSNRGRSLNCLCGPDCLTRIWGHFRSPQLPIPGTANGYLAATLLSFAQPAQAARSDARGKGRGASAGTTVKIAATRELRHTAFAAAGQCVGADFAVVADIFEANRDAFGDAGLLHRHAVQRRRGGHCFF
jgi:hypothetical protein